MTVEIRQIRDDELPAFVDTLSTAFLERPDIEKAAAEVRPLWDLGRAWAAFDAGRMCGTFRSGATELTVPGGERLPASAVSAVTVLPTHRRRGILRGMVAAEHGATRERGEVVGLLFASEYPIYSRFGYGPACREATWTLDTHRSEFRTGQTGGVELVKPDGDAATAMKAVYDAWRRRQPGEIRRRDVHWEYDLGIRESAWGPTWKGFVVLHRDPTGAVDGYARYHVDDKWEQRQPRNIIIVDDLHALTDESYASLWRYLAEIDWAATVKAERRSPAERLPWLLANARAAEISNVGDGMWVRLLDVRQALEARTYDREAHLVLDVVDREAPGGRTRVLLDASPAGATCAGTQQSADLTLDVAALSAAYLGGVPLRDAVMASGVDEHRDGALDEADALFRTLDEPWSSTFF